MSNTIPPLVCDSPPPIDDLVSDDDFSEPEHYDETPPVTPAKQSYLAKVDIDVPPKFADTRPIPPTNNNIHELNDVIDIVEIPSQYEHQHSIVTSNNHLNHTTDCGDISAAVEQSNETVLGSMREQLDPISNVENSVDTNVEPATTTTTTAAANEFHGKDVDDTYEDLVQNDVHGTIVDNFLQNDIYNTNVNNCVQDDIHKSNVDNCRTNINDDEEENQRNSAYFNPNHSITNHVINDDDDADYNVPSLIFEPITYSNDTENMVSIEDDFEYEMEMRRKTETENQILDSLEFKRLEIRTDLDVANMFSVTENNNESINASDDDEVSVERTSSLTETITSILDSKLRQNNDVPQEQHEEQENLEQQQQQHQQPTNDIDFDADFSQFACFESAPSQESYIPPPLPLVMESQPTTINDASSITHFDDVTNTTAFNDNNNGNIANDDDDDDDDDDFGDFNDFQQTAPIEPIPTTNQMGGHIITHIEDVQHEFNSILASMFPNGEANESTTGDDRLKCAESFSNEITRQLQIVDEAKAIVTNNNWKKSVSKSFLVKALGIDQRNILYGDKWTSSAMKFASNLGSSPLEPMKILQPTVAVTCASTATPLNPTKASVPKSTKPTIDVPAAQFDWNSSGLTNPLDALHAHTLLLDLEQLVVVANLDNINLNSSPSSYSTCNTTTPLAMPMHLTTTTTITTQQYNSTQSNCGSPILKNPFDLANNERSSPNTKIIPLRQHSPKTSTKRTNSMDNSKQFERYLSKPRNVPADDQSSRWNGSIPLEPTTAPTISPVSLDSLSIQDLDMPITTNHINVDINELASTIYDSDDSSPTITDSYTVPGSSGTMKETHIFTPSKPNGDLPPSIIPTYTLNATTTTTTTATTTAAASTTSNAKIDESFVNNSIVINESVVRKEYHDIDYDSSKLSTAVDDFAEFQSVPTTDTSSDDTPKYKGDTFAMDVLPTISNNSRNHTKQTIDNNKPNQFDTMPPLDPLPNRVESSDICATSVNNHIHASHFDMFESFDKPSINGSGSIEPNSSPDVFSISSSTPSHLFSISEPSDPQPAPSDIKPTNDAPIIVPPQPQRINTFGILIPQTINNAPPATSPIVVPTIAWPDPGLDTQQLQQFETRLPTTNRPTTTITSAATNKSRSVCEPNHNISTEEDEWSDFVSVAQPQTPITNILNQNLLKQQSNANDEDDWSEFVSSTNAPPTAVTSTGFLEPSHFLQKQQHQLQQQHHHQQQQSQHHSPFRVANDLSQMSNNNNNNISNHLHSNMKFSVPHNHHNSQYQPTISSSIISGLPDLRFVAPKSLVNMPARTLAKK